ncbi:hypothetical protein ACFYT4_25275 [Streptomyces sp. NPDC004609]|uniref:hypothetical protein n=1 Tax=Streptomyces sp. NPDC004609 TaxID=3364704 RepID=UPI00368FE4A0
MRDRIARALIWVLAQLPLTRRARPGRHSAEHFAEHLARQTAPAPAPLSLVICAPRTPVPVHVLTRTVPVPKPPRVPPYLRGWITAQEAEWEQQRHQQRRVSAVAATMGYDVPFPFDGSDVARVGMSA